MMSGSQSQPHKSIYLVNKTATSASQSNVCKAKNTLWARQLLGDSSKRGHSREKNEIVTLPRTPNFYFVLGVKTQNVSLKLNYPMLGILQLKTSYFQDFNLILD